MSFLIQRSAGRGLSLTQIATDVLRIGRGTNQELRSENPAVALEHAIVEGDAAGYVITDKGSITGTYVNGKPVESSRLSKGDVIEIGDLRVEVQLADPTKPLFLRVVTARSAMTAAFEEEDEPEVAAATPATPGARVVKPKKIDYASAYRLTRPYLTKVGITALLLIIALVVVGEVALRPERHQAFMPGGLSSAHAGAKDPRGFLVADRCDTCHTPFKSVSNESCIACHPHEPHARFEINPPDCFACHGEHRGNVKLADISNDRCVACHSDLTKHVRAPGVQLASLRFGNARYTFNDIARIDDFGGQHPELAWSADRNTLLFNHKLHLSKSGQRNDTGRPEVLQCEACHQMTTAKERTDPVPLEFEKHCQRCHRLTFDSRFPTAEMPHGVDARTAEAFVAFMYAGDNRVIGKDIAEVRRILAQRRQITPDERAVQAARQAIRKCDKCHEVQRRNERLVVTPPVLLTQWLGTATYTHTREQHRAGCESCHEGARASVATSDVLLPQRADCTTCHSKNAKGSQADSKCRLCHEYHLRPQRQVVAASLAPAVLGGLGREGRMVEGVLLAVIVILLLVVLVPVGIALFQRLRPERSSERPPSAPPRAPAPPPPSRAPEVRADSPTTKVPKLRDLPPPAPPPAPPSPDATRIEMLPDMPKQPASAGTEMVQWYGMLHCTGGALEGQRFVIEEGGFYIGRDPALSKVAVPDNRISRRHVRILPRDGKVFAIDEGSANGTFLASAPGQRITEVQLKRGDTLILGDKAATFAYQI